MVPGRTLERPLPQLGGSERIQLQDEGTKLFKTSASHVVALPCGVSGEPDMITYLQGNVYHDRPHAWAQSIMITKDSNAFRRDVVHGTAGTR